MTENVTMLKILLFELFYRLLAVVEAHPTTMEGKT